MKTDKNIYQKNNHILDTYCWQQINNSAKSRGYVQRNLWRPLLSVSELFCGWMADSLVYLWSWRIGRTQKKAIFVNDLSFLWPSFCTDMTFIKKWKENFFTSYLCIFKVQSNLELRTILVTQFLVLKVKLVLILTVQVSSRVLAIPCFTLIDFSLLLNSVLTQK